MLSGRVPWVLEPNAWSRALASRRASGDRLLDLTETNPTLVGLHGLSSPESLAAAEACLHRPDPKGLSGARRNIADLYAERGLELSQEDLILTSGTSESYAHLFRLLADPGEVVLIPSPSYPLFEPIAAIAAVRTLPYRLEYAGRWELDLDSLEGAIEEADGRARAVVVVEPNHPTGSCLDPRERAALESLCERRALAIVSDEVFADFPWPPRTEPLPSWLGERRVPTFALGGLSKSCGMPQLKLGWIALAGPESERARARAGLEWIADVFLSVNAPVQLALARLLEEGRAYRARVRARLESNLGTLTDLTRRRPEITLLPGEGGWAAILRLPATRSGEEWALSLLERGLVMHPGHFYDLTGEAYLVSSLIPEPDVLAGGLAILEEELVSSAR